MDREDILRMAREAGSSAIDPLGLGAIDIEWLERFAALVAAAERERYEVIAMKAAEEAVDVAMRLEREACARVCEQSASESDIGQYVLTDCAAAIRARGEQ